MKYKKLIIIFFLIIFLFNILIYGMGNQKNLAKKSQEIFKENNQAEEELIKDLEILENFEMFINFDFFKDIADENE
ncbi:MAG: hypothetical protein N3E50_02780 [Candidatus Goldbacteria bacterium]|nr:hypothetical protein [Candidatus Goldiibacteriota bacterium]